LRAGAGAVGVDADGELLRQLAATEQLDRIAALGEAGLAKRLGGYLGAGVEAVVEVGDIDRLGAGPKRLERHRHPLVRAAELAGPHVDRVLPALVGRLALRSRARAGPLVP